MIACIAIDDEPLALKQLEGYISKTPFLHLAKGCHSALEAREFLSQNNVDLIFTDINMPDCDGLQFVKSLAHPPLVVFSTAYEQYALESYRVDAIDYLLKPYSYQDFLQVALKAKQFHEWKVAASADHSVKCADYFFVRADNRSVKIEFDKILYVEAMSEYIRIHFLDGTSLMTFMSIKLMADSLPEERFMRIHRSYIIDLERIKSLHRSEVELSDGTKVPISASYKEALQKYVGERLLERK